MTHHDATSLAATQPRPAEAGRRALAVVSRPPVPGAVKTRLAEALGPGEALAVYRRLLAGTLAAAERLSEADLVLAVAPVVADGREAVGACFGARPGARAGIDAFDPPEPGRWRVIEQHGDGLGERLAGVFADLFAEGCEAVVIVDSDSPGLPPEYLEQAFDAVAASPDGLVLGPAADGGFYLVGAGAAAWRRSGAALTRALASAPMGTARALAHLERGARRAGVEVTQLPLWIDVDEVGDLVWLDRLAPVPGAAVQPPRGEPLGRLREIYLHVTNRCGLPCPHCYNRSNATRRGELTTRDWKDAVDACVELGAGSFVVLGGDPFLRDDLSVLIDHVTGRRERKARIFFNNEISPTLAAELAAVGHGRLRPLVSVDGVEDVNDALRRRGNYATSLASIRNLVAAGLAPVANTVVLAPILPGLPRLARELQAVGVTRLHLIFPHQRGGLPEHMDLVPGGEAMLAAFRELRRTCDEIGLVLDNVAAWKRRLAAPSDFCAAGCRDLAIDPYGRVFACTITCGDPAFSAGDLRRDDLETIWRRSPALRLLRQAHARDRRECADCPVVDACGGECWMQAHYAARVGEAAAGFTAPFPYCEFIRPVFEELLAEARRTTGGGPAACDAGACPPPPAVDRDGAAVDYALFDCI